MNLDNYLPKGQYFFSLSAIKEIGLMSRERAKQLIHSGELAAVKNGQKWMVPRAELLRYIKENLKPNNHDTLRINMTIGQPTGRE